MYADRAAEPVTLRTLRAMKSRGERITACTAYDATFGALLDRNGVEWVLVGDSLGNVIQGHATTLPVTVEHVAYHVEAVARGVKRALLAADMPFASCGDPRSALRNAARLMRAGAALVKVEGAGPMLDVIAHLVQRDVPVCAHLGLTPQSVHRLGGYRVQGRDADSAGALRDAARAVVQAGAELLVLELVPAALAREIATELAIPVIGIGAGPGCDGQILVGYDVLGLTPGRRPRFVRDFLAGRGSADAAIGAYVEAVRSGSFPGETESW